MDKKQIIVCIKPPLITNSNSHYIPLYAHDLQIIKMALQLKLNYNYKITAISAEIGTNYYSTKDTLQNVLFTGIDKVITIKPKNIITYNNKNYYYKHIIIGHMLSECIKNLKNYNIILCGNKSVNNIPKIGIYLSTMLNVLKIWNIKKIICTQHNSTIKIYYKNKNFIESIQLSEPSLFTVINDNSNENITKFLSAKNIMKYNKIKFDKELQNNKSNTKIINDNTIIQEFICNINKNYLNKFQNNIIIRHNKKDKIINSQNNKNKIVKNIDEEELISILNKYIT